MPYISKIDFGDGTEYEFKPSGSGVDSLDDIGDVDITSPSTGNVLKYNGTSSKWENGALGTAASKDVPTSGNASSTQVVMGDDSRLSDARSASDVYSWAKASTKPSYTASEVGLGNVGNFLAVSTAASQGLSDTQKSNARANINAQQKSTVYSKSLAASATSVEFTSVTLGTSSKVDIATSQVGLDYNSVSVSGSTVTVTFDAQSSAVTVYLIVTEV